MKSCEMCQGSHLRQWAFVGSRAPRGPEAATPRQLSAASEGKGLFRFWGFCLQDLALCSFGIGYSGLGLKGSGNFRMSNLQSKVVLRGWHLEL